jgi:signal transduction histidine kinase/CheY-like chemotaxis protein
MKLTTVIRTFAVLLALFAITNTALTYFTENEQSRQEKLHRDWNEDEKLLVRTLYEVDAMRRFLSLFITTSDKVHLQRYVEIINLHRGLKRYANDIGIEHWIQYANGEGHLPLLLHESGPSLPAQLQGLQVADRNSPILMQIYHLSNDLISYETSNLRSVAYNDNTQAKFMIFDQDLIEKTNLLSSKISNFILDERNSYRMELSKSRESLRDIALIDKFVGLAFFLAFGLALLAAKIKVINPINRVILASKQILRGEYNATVTEARGAEDVAVLTRTFNQVATLFRNDREKTEAIRATLVKLTQANADKDRAVAESHFKSSFLANMSHEIRTPMTAILGMTRLVLRSNLTAKQRDYLSKIELSGNNLLGLINSILDLSKIESNNITLSHEPFTLDSVLNEVFSTLSNPATENRNRLVFKVESPSIHSASSRLVGDALRVGQILKNLVSNAIKFTKRGHVVISVFEAARNDTSIRLGFRVTDTGIGMSQDVISGIFEKFVQADSSTTRNYGGTGLGLAISKELIHLMGGEIYASSQPGKGSEFTFEIALGLSQGADKPINTVDRVSKVIVCSLDDATRLAIPTLLPPEHPSEVVFMSYDELQRVEFDPDCRIVLDECGLISNDPEGYCPLLIPQHLREISVLIQCSLSSDASREVRSMEPVLRVPAPLIPVHLDALLMNEAVPVEEKAALVVTDNGVRIESWDSTPVYPESPAPRIEILVVEDNPLNREMLADFLAPYPINLCTAENGVEAINEIHHRDWPFDMIITDVEMPIMDGYQLAEKVREMPPYKGTPILALTAHAFSETNERCMGAGIDRVLTKPYNEADLITCIKDLVGNRAKVDIAVPAEPASSNQASEVFNPLTIFRAGELPEERFRKYIEHFYLHFEPLPARLKAFTAENNPDDFAREVHSLAGVVGMLCQESYKPIFTEVERMVKSGVPMDQCLEHIEPHLNLLLSAAEFILTKEKT